MRSQSEAAADRESAIGSAGRRRTRLRASFPRRALARSSRRACCASSPSWPGGRRPAASRSRAGRRRRVAKLPAAPALGAQLAVGRVREVEVAGDSRSADRRRPPIWRVSRPTSAARMGDRPTPRGALAYAARNLFSTLTRYRPDRIRASRTPGPARASSARRADPRRRAVGGGRSLPGRQRAHARRRRRPQGGRRSRLPRAAPCGAAPNLPRAERSAARDSRQRRPRGAYRQIPEPSSS
jgi:hypothetical protein